MTSENKQQNNSITPTAKQSNYDVIVIGGGHNGLITAAYLAKAGRKVLVLEKRELLGGIAVTEELLPGCKFSSLTDEVGYLSPAVSSDLNLAQHGLQILATDPLIFSPQADGSELTLWHDVNQTVREIAKFSLLDADAYPRFIKMMSKISRIVAGLNNMTPPDVPDIGMGDMSGMFKLAKPVLSLGWKNITQVMRLMSLSLSDLLAEWFESDIVKGAIGAAAVNHISWGPQESGTAYTFLSNWSNSNNGLFRSSGQVKGGIGCLTQALANAARSLGVEILTNSEVTKIITQNGQATGLLSANGDQLSAAIIVSAADMRTTFLKLLGPDNPDEIFVKQVSNIKYRGTMARLHFVLDKLPTFRALNSNNNALQHLSGHIQIAPTLTYIQKAYDPVKYGRYSARPYLDIRIPTLTDSSLVPAGKQIMSVTVKYIPYHLRQGNWNELRDALAQLVMETITQYAPDFPQCAPQSHVITPLELETTYNLPEGNLLHGEMSLDQFLWMRPIPGYAQYRSPIDGLYLCGSATHPGGCITGLNGRNAAREILRSAPK